MFVALFFAANVLFCLAYVVRDMAYLRSITIIAASCTLPYFYFQPVPLYSAMGWQMAFILINGVNLTLLLLERRPVHLDATEQRLHNLTFRNLTPREMLRVLAIGQWRRAEPGERLIEQGTHIDELMLIYSGRAEVRIEGAFRANVGPGDFLGEMSFATRQPTSADVDATDTVTCLVWRRDDLLQLLDRHPRLNDAILAIIGVDMAQKLSRPADQS